MSYVEPGAPGPEVAAVDAPFRYMQWGPVIAGALLAAALALVLHAFAAGLGLSIGSTAPTGRDASFALILLSGLYLLVVAFISYGLGALLGAAVAWFAACAGGRDRDGEVRSMLYGWWHQAWWDEGRDTATRGRLSPPPRGA